MKSIVIYSSQTGNTKKVARGIANSLSCELVSFEEELAKKWNEFDFIALGFWVDKGFADQKMKAFMQGISNKNIGLFMTLGAEPDGEYAKETLQKTKDMMIANNCKILKEFISQGSIDPNTIITMRQLAEKLGDKFPHPVTPQREARWIQAASHPDETDIRNAMEAFKFSM